MPADIVALITTGLTAIAPYAEELVKGISSGVGGKLADWFKGYLTDEDDKETFYNYLKNPQDAELKGELKGVLKKALKGNDALATELEMLVKAVEAEQEKKDGGKNVNVRGNHNIVSTDNKNTTITITQNIPPQQN